MSLFLIWDHKAPMIIDVSIYRSRKLWSKFLPYFTNSVFRSNKCLLDLIIPINQKDTETVVMVSAQPW